MLCCRKRVVIEEVDFLHGRLGHEVEDIGAPSAEPDDRDAPVGKPCWVLAPQVRAC
jgi:hypothetical protein